MKVNELIDNVFKNVFLISVAEKLDLGHIVSFVEQKMVEATDDSEIEQKYTGLLFVELLAEEMGISPGDILNYDAEYRQELVKMIITTLSMEGVILDINKAENENDESYITYVISDLKVFDKLAKFSYSPDTEIEEEKNDYIIELVNKNNVYSMSILTNNITNSNYFRGQVEVWSEDKGLLADFLDEALEENLSLAFKEGMTEEELVACVFDDTRTINLMDKFEGFGEKYDRSYQRLVIKNGMLFCNYGDPYIHLVIERRTSNKIKGNITFTEFKQGENTDLRQHIIEELDHSILYGYCDKNEFYRFKTAYLLRAQNSKNRSGYGWIWNWKDGVGTYVKGTEYGETTDYVFVGAYISSSFLFDPGKRAAMMQVYETQENYEDEFDNVEEKTESSVVGQNSGENVSFGSENCFKKTSESRDEVNDEKTGQKEKTEAVHIYDVEELIRSGYRKEIVEGMRVKYKKIHTNEEVEEIIGSRKLLHKKLIGKKPGEIISEGARRYLIVSVENN